MHVSPFFLPPRPLCHAGYKADGASDETSPSELPHDGKKKNMHIISISLLFC